MKDNTLRNTIAEYVGIFGAEVVDTGGNADESVPVDAILAAIKNRLPKEVHYNEETVPKYLKPAIGENWQQAIRHEQGWNDCLSEVKQALDIESES